MPTENSYQIIARQAGCPDYMTEDELNSPMSAEELRELQDFENEQKKIAYTGTCIVCKKETSVNRPNWRLMACKEHTDKDIRTALESDPVMLSHVLMKYAGLL